MPIDVQITFGIIVLNGQPFIKHNIKSLYRWAHQIIVVEGACVGAANVIATSDGHSTDGTLTELWSLVEKEDPEGKIEIVTAEMEGRPSGFWTEKLEMSQAYARRASGNYLWQVDCDEFYRDEDMRKILHVLGEGVSAISFPTRNFWGGPGYITEAFVPWYNHTYALHRLFAWQKGFRYTDHRPPTVVDAEGCNLRARNAITAAQMRSMGVYVFHYSLLFPKQVRAKCEYYSNVKWTHHLRGAGDWVNSTYDKLEQVFRVERDYRMISWLRRYDGPHPSEATTMLKEVLDGKYPGITFRENSDVENVLRSPWYRLGTAALRAANAFMQPYWWCRIACSRRRVLLFRGEL